MDETFRRNWAVTILTIAILSGCVSTHNFRTDGISIFGGGFFDEELRPGLHKMTAVGSTAPWPTFGAAKATWKSRADQLCGIDAYSEIVSSENAGLRGTTPIYVAPARQVVPVPSFNAMIHGYVLCKHSGITVEEAVKYLEELQAAVPKMAAEFHKTELEKLGGDDCSDNAQNFSPDTYLRRGKSLIALNRYMPAMQCLLRAQEGGSSTYVYREACSLISTMYELGWGVERNNVEAAAWLKKANLPTIK